MTSADHPTSPAEPGQPAEPRSANLAFVVAALLSGGLGLILPVLMGLAEWPPSAVGRLQLGLLCWVVALILVEVLHGALPAAGRAAERTMMAGAHLVRAAIFAGITAWWWSRDPAAVLLGAVLASATYAVVLRALARWTLRRPSTIS